jgi:hypothetical protein
MKRLRRQWADENISSTAVNDVPAIGRLNAVANLSAVEYATTTETSSSVPPGLSTADV